MLKSYLNKGCTDSFFGVFNQFSLPYKGSYSRLMWMLEHFEIPEVKVMIPYSLKIEFKDMHDAYCYEYDGSDELKDKVYSFFNVFFPRIEPYLKFLEQEIQERSIQKIFTFSSREF